MKIIKLVFLVFLGFLGALVSPIFAQSNVSYDLHVGTTAENTLLNTFPDSYAGEKINITVRVEHLELTDETDSIDFIFSNHQLSIAIQAFVNPFFEFLHFVFVDFLKFFFKGGFVRLPFFLHLQELGVFFAGPDGAVAARFYRAINDDRCTVKCYETVQFIA